MTKNIIFKKWLTRYWYFIFLFFFFLFLISLPLKFLGNFIDQKLKLEVRAGKEKVIEETVEIEVLFNSKNSEQELFSRIEKEIDSSKKTLDIAMYALTSQRLKEAISRAAARGVIVSIVADSQKEEEQRILFSEILNNFSIVYPINSDKSRSLMHHKFAIIDQGEVNEVLIFGSLNWTDLQEKYDSSFLAVIKNKDIIASFAEEFNRLKKGISGRDKIKLDHYNIWDLSLKNELNNYEVWFSPGTEGKNINLRLLDLINSAKSDIKIIIWDFTDKDLAVALMKQARQGVKVTLMTDTWNFNNKNSVFSYLLETQTRYDINNFILLSDYFSDQEVKNSLDNDNLEEDFDPFLHHHLLIIDDSVVLFGTNNWSRSAAFYNDESVVITDDKNVVDLFLNEFNYHWEANTIF